MNTGNKPPIGIDRPDPRYLIELANYKMPYGKYKGYYLVNIPEYYYIWYKRKGFPNGKLGNMMQEICEIKVNGLEALLLRLIKK